MDIAKLVRTTKALVAPGKGILAADESTQTIARRFESVRVDSTEKTRRDYRELLIRTPGISEYISGVILFDETIRQKTADGTAVVDLLTQQGIMAGIKVDTGGKPLAGAPGEQVTEGLDGLRERLSEYAEMGARFTKWRAVIAIGESIPSSYCIEANAHALGRFAALSQEVGLVPIVEPEILIDGDHGIDRCFEATESTLREVFHQLGRQRVLVEGTLLKSSMVLWGKEATHRASAEEVARQTLACLMRVVPPAVPGIVFLSGGQEDDDATANLDAINRHAAEVGAPWELSFSYGRALQAAPLRAWAGQPSNAERAQHEFYHRARVTSAARTGTYTPAMDKELAAS